MNEFTADRLIAEGAAELSAVGISGARMESALLLRHAAGFSREALIREPRLPVSACAATEFLSMVGQRKNHTPIAHLTRRKEFWGREFIVSADTLVPRPESELLVEVVLGGLNGLQEPISVLDIGTGSGCLLLSLLSEIDGAVGMGVDVSAGALSIAAANARALHLEERAEFRKIDVLAGTGWIAEVSAPYNVIVCNPPYIPSGTIMELDRDVAEHEPRAAIDGGVDGLMYYRHLSRVLSALTSAGGRVVFEVGPETADRARHEFAEQGFKCLEMHQDLAGIQRCLSIRNGPEEQAAIATKRVGNPKVRR